MFCFSLLNRIVTGNNTNNKSESDQEDNDDVNDNDWSYGAEKKGAVMLVQIYMKLDMYFQKTYFFQLDLNYMKLKWF